MPSPSARRLVPIAFAAGLGASACNLSAFDDRRRTAWSDSARRPAGVTSDDFGAAVTTVDRELPGATIVVAGAGPLSISTLSYDDHGARSARGTDLVPRAVDRGMTIVGALDPVVGADGVVAVGNARTPDEILFYDARSGAAGPSPRGRIEAGACGELAGLGQSMVFGLAGVGVAEEPELVALAGSELVVFPDIDIDVDVGVDADEPRECWRCTLADAAMEPVMGLQVAVADAGEPDGEEIVVLAGPSAAAPAAVLLLAAASVADGGLCSPLVAPIAPPAADGLAPIMDVGDVDGNELPDVALAAPDFEKVHVVRDVSTSGPAGPYLVIVAPAGSVEFGTDLAFGDFDGDELEELAVSDPAASPVAEAGPDAGQVTVYRFDMEDDALVPEATLHDSAPERGQLFGRSLAVAEFVAGGEQRDLLVVGARREVFTYFRPFAAADDPRH